MISNETIVTKKKSGFALEFSFGFWSWCLTEDYMNAGEVPHH